MMDILTLMDGLKANYPQAQHPLETAEKDFMRTLRNMGFTPPQLDLIYDQLLKDCQFFPKVFNIHDAVMTLNLVLPEKNEVTRTDALLGEYKEHQRGAISFQTWLHTGGYQFIAQDCGYDQEKIRKRLRAMGCVDIVQADEKPKDHKSEFESIGGSIPDFPCAEPSTAVHVEHVEQEETIDDL